MAAREAPTPALHTWVDIDYADAHGRRHTTAARLAAAGNGTWTLTDGGDAPAIRVGAEITLTFQAGRQIYCGLTRVVRVRPDLVVRRPVHLQPTTRRQAYRVAARLAADTSLGPGELRELSGAGGLLALAGSVAPEAGTPLHMNLRLAPEGPPLALRATVRRVAHADADLVLLAIAFDAPLEKHQEAIGRYVAERQRAMLQQRWAALD